MNRSSDLRLACGVSVGLHAALLIGWPVATPPQFDVERAPTSVELYLVQAQPAPPVAPLPQAPVSPPPPEPDVSERVERVERVEPQPQTVAAPEIQGAIAEELPQYRRNPPPVYPRAARERGDEGTVLLEVEVLASGRCGTINVLSSSGHAVLDEAAVRAVRGWIFRPARRWDQPVAFWVEIPITFRLIEGQGALGAAAQEPRR